MNPIRGVDPERMTTGETLPVTVSVICLSWFLFRSSVHTFGMLPLRATGSGSVTFGSLAVDVKTSVWSSMNLAAVSSWAPNVSCFFSPLPRSTRNSLSLPATRPA